jgi:hypothetical protein
LAAFGLSAGILATGPVQRVYSHVEYVGSPEFDDLFVEKMIERCRRLVHQWAAEEPAAAGAH